MRDSVSVTTLVQGDPLRVFALFTEQVDAWWGRGPRFRLAGSGQGTMLFEPHPGGRFVERRPGQPDRVIGQVRDWQPGERLAFSFRVPHFPEQSSAEQRSTEQQDTEVEVRFIPVGERTRVITRALKAYAAFATSADRGGFRKI